MEVFDHHEEDSPGMNRRKTNTTTIAVAPYDSNTIDADFCADVLGR